MGSSTANREFLRMAQRKQAEIKLTLHHIREYFCSLIFHYNCIWISAEVRSCALQYVFLSTESAVCFWEHCALEVVEKVVLTVYMCTNDIKFL